MTGRLEEIWRYPLKAISRERLDTVRLTQGETLPWDRYWAVIHDAAADRLEAPGRLAGWLPKSSFLRGVAAPGLQAVTGGLVNGRLLLSHPQAGEISVDPASAEDEAALIDWLARLWPDDKPAPAQLVSGPDPLTDSRKPMVSINSLDSLHELEIHVGKRLGTPRWRGNLWVEGFAPFAERDWIGRRIRIGQAELRVVAPIGRCAATSVETSTGMPDMDMVRILTERYEHSNFGVYAEVIGSGQIAVMNEVLVGDAPEAEEPSA